MSQPAKNVAAQTAAKKQNNLMTTYIHCAIGIGFMLLFPMLPPIEPMTEIGMVVLATFIGMIYLWSTVNSTWPSLLGLMLIALSGYAGPGYGGMKSVIMNSFGMDTVIIALFSMVLFGAVEYVGCSAYIARWFLTRPIINGRPYVFILVFLLCCYVLSALTSPITSLFILWAIAVDILAILNISKTDKFYPIFIVGTFFAATIGQPMLPFKGAQLIVVSAYEQMSGQVVNHLSYITFNFIMSMLLMAVFLLFIKFVFRPDISNLKNINIDQFNANPLPPMNQRQKLFLWMIVVYISMLLAPSFLPATVPGIQLLKDLGVLGVTIICVVVMCIIHVDDGRPALQFREVAAKQLSWDVFFLIAAAVYAANAVSNDITGIKEWMIQVLNPILGGRPEFIFAVLLFLVALILTNFANNAAMAVVLMPIIIAFCDQGGMPSMPFAMGVAMMVFVAMLTPSASPHAGMMHGRKDLVSTGDIMRIGFPLVLAALVVYVIIGFPIAKILFA
ncbi:MAG: SLC13 family permease [Peptococcales bacterium]|jgi:sodium-dependent dicarboxylate transporter 2/3/5